MAEEPGTPAQQSLTFEEARDELMRIVAQLESGGMPLAESLALWERGEALADVCQRWLDGARERISTLHPETAHRPED